MNETKNNDGSVVKNDKYDYETSIQNLKNLEYATQEKGHKSVKVITIKKKDKITVSFTGDILSRNYLYSNTKENIMTSCSSKKISAGCKKCNGLCWSGSTCRDYDGVNTTTSEITVYSLKKASSIEDKYFESAIDKDRYPNAKVLSVSNKSISGPVEGKKYIADGDVNKSAYSTYNKNVTISWCWCRENKDVTATYCNPPQALLNMGYNKMPDLKTTRISGLVEVEYDYAFNGNEYTGSLSKKTDETENDKATTSDDKVICLYDTNMDLYFFGDTTFSHWINVIKQSKNQQLILDEIRNYINEHLELVLLNKINTVIGSYVQSLNSDAFFVDIPIGPPLLTVPSSYVVEYKNYFPTFKVDNKIDTSLIKYDTSKSAVNVINSVSCNKSNESKNYLDVSFSNIISLCRNLDEFDKSSGYLYIILPSKGYQLFEIIDKSIISIAPNSVISGYGSINNTNSILYDYESSSKIIISFVDFSNDTKLKTILSNYKFLTSVSVPMIEFKQNKEFVNVSINTLTNSNENKVYIYISSDKTQELVSNVKGSGSTDSSEQNIDKNKIVNNMINVQYNGIDSNRTPMCLQLHFV